MRTSQTPLRILLQFSEAFPSQRTGETGRKHCAAMFSARVPAGGRRSKSNVSALLAQRRWYAARTAQRTVLYLKMRHAGLLAN
jgi:hypothetical protein